MKITHLLFVLALFSFASCGDDDSGGSDSYLLSYDGANDSAPPLEAGIHVLAVRFPSDELKNHIGKKLIEIEAYVDVGAVSYKALVMDKGTSNSPGSTIREVDFSNNVNTRKWVIVEIDPLEITGEDIWIGVEVVHDQTAFTVGCDAGPRREDGDWIWDSNNNTWQSFLSLSGDGINWNIRGHLED